LAYARNSVKFLENQGFSVVKPSAQIMLDKALELFNQVGVSSVPETVKTVIQKYDIKISNIAEISKIKTLDDVRQEFKEWLSKQPFSGGELAYNQIDENGDVFRYVSMAWPNKKTPSKDYLVPLVHPVTNKPCVMPERGWRNPTETMKRLIENGEIAFGKDETTQPQRIYKLKQHMSAAFSSVMPFGGSDDALLAKMGIPFDTPKPVEVAKQLIASCTKDNDIILDFFAGSGTTAHATIMQNLIDKGNRKFILVNIDEETSENSEARKKGFKTVSEITRKRIKLALEDQLSGTTNGLRCFKVGASNFVSFDNRIDSQEINLFASTLKFDAGNQAIATEIFLKLGVRLDAAVEVMQIAGGEVFISETVGAVVSKSLSNDLIGELFAFSKIQTWVFLEDAFEGKDDVKANTFFLFKQANKAMRTL
jgi:adenine-specific DNA-methyltransferase